LGGVRTAGADGLIQPGTPSNYRNAEEAAFVYMNHFSEVANARVAADLS